MSDCVLVDFSWIVHRSFHAFPDLSATVDGQSVKTGTLYGVTRFVETVLKRDPESSLIFCLDSPFISRRVLNKNYKANRERKADVYAHKEELLRVLAIAPQASFSFDFEAEADDLMAALFFEKQKEGERVTIYTGDNDLAQLMHYGAVVSREMKLGRFVPLREDYLIEKYGVESSLLAYYKALKGDPSDNIAGAGVRMRKKDVWEFCNQWRETGSVEEAASRFTNNPDLSEKLIDKLFEALPVIKANYNLVNLCQNEGRKVAVNSGVPDVSLLDKFQLYSFKKFLAESGAIS